ncbi:2-nitropropane dioxygenase [Tardibacter chloracetimidivorans]|uniref:2-nitropropane dioxygenase n=1 Tax=Tardibacter chloracetimidivorans TaxID=1921510 RepID=A0A1L3ZVT7_9SPHN|nr:nitronate monooxygenase [Tardibacter chloracetimidivorans]API59742.1 2-nitropropane dioxygenase [Tardibacter chloracetimidivorans]
MNFDDLKTRLRLPVVAAPMLLVSGPDLVIAAGQAGILGAFPALNARSTDQLKGWLEKIEGTLDEQPYAVNLIIQGPGAPRFADDLRLLEAIKPPVVITSVGNPAEAVERIHAFGGLVFHDVATLRHAQKAIAAGVDGLILLTAGAGGHTGTANPFAFVSQVRAFWNGPILLAGAISDGSGIAAARALGADLVYMGTRFAASEESLASEAYKALLVSETMADVVLTDRISGLPATFLRGSIVRAGLDPDALPDRLELFKPNLPEGIKAWRDVWSGGHGVGSIIDTPPVAEIVDRLVAEYEAAKARIKAI